MADYLALMAAHLKQAVQRTDNQAAAGATLMHARAHLEPRAWDQWVTQEVGMPVEKAHSLMDAAERAGASLDTLRPPEL